jgi:hypothetical protein
VDLFVELEQTGQSRWGFELTVLDAADQPAGTIVRTDQDRTQIGTANGRQYLKHTFAGTDAGTGDASPGWAFQWTAPAQGAGIVTFYVAGVAANNNNNNSGDYTYTETMSFDQTPVETITWGRIKRLYE